MTASWKQARPRPARDLRSGAGRVGDGGRKGACPEGADCSQAGLQKEQAGQGHQRHPRSSRHHSVPLLTT